MYEKEVRSLRKFMKSMKDLIESVMIHERRLTPRLDFCYQRQRGFLAAMAQAFPLNFRSAVRLARDEDGKPFTDSEVKLMLQFSKGAGNRGGASRFLDQKKVR